MTVRYNLKNVSYTILASSMTDSATQMRIKLNTSAQIPAPPALVLVSRSRGLLDLRNAELIRLDSVVQGDPDLFNITRNFDGKGAQAHVAGEMILCNIFAEHIINMYDVIDLFSEFLCKAYGSSSSGVIRDDDNGLKVDTDGLKITVKAGYAFIDKLPVKLAEDYESENVTLPTVSTRYDLVTLTKEGTINIIKGNEGAAVPNTPVGELALGSVEINVGAVTLEDKETDERTYF